MEELINSLADAIRLKIKEQSRCDNNLKIEIKQIIRQPEDRNWKEIFLAHLLDTISRAKDLSEDQIKLVDFMNKKVGEMDSYFVINDRAAKDYFTRNLLEVARLRANEKCCKYTFLHLKNRLIQVDCTIEPIPEEDKLWIKSNFQNSIFNNLFIQKFPNFELKLETALSNTYFCNFMQESENGITLLEDAILISDKFRGDDTKKKFGMLIAFSQEFLEFLNITETIEIEPIEKKKRRRDDKNYNFNDIINELLGYTLYFINDEIANCLLNAKGKSQAIVKNDFLQVMLNTKSWNNIVGYEVQPLNKLELWNDIKSLFTFSSLNELNIESMTKYYYQISRACQSLLDSNQFLDHKTMYLAICGLSVNENIKGYWYDHCFKNSELPLYWKKMKYDYSIIFNSSADSTPFLFYYVCDYFIRQIALNINETSCINEFNFALNLSSYHKPFFKKLSDKEINEIKPIFMTKYIQGKFAVDGINYESLVDNFLNKTFKYNLNENICTNAISSLFPLIF